MAADGSAPSRQRLVRKALLAVDPCRKSAVDKQALEIPRLYRVAYVRAAAGKASPRSAIKAFCLTCVVWQRHEVAHCTSVACPLYEYRPWKQ